MKPKGIALCWYCKERPHIAKPVSIYCEECVARMKKGEITSVLMTKFNEQQRSSINRISGIGKGFTEHSGIITTPSETKSAYDGNFDFDGRY